MPNLKRSSVYVDAQGRTRQCIVLGNASLAGVEAALLGASNADIQQSWEATPVVNAAPAPINLPYASVADYVPLVFQDAVGGLVYITLVAPQSSIFQADGETVNPPAIAGIVTAVVGTVLTGNGMPAATFVGGTRRRSLKEYQ